MVEITQGRCNFPAPINLKLRKEYPLNLRVSTRALHMLGKYKETLPSF